jgi:nitrogen fixation/metabolism regulation signal transduction histidine kinase
MNFKRLIHSFITPKNCWQNILLIILSFLLLAIVVWRWFDCKIEKIHQQTITVKQKNY